MFFPIICLYFYISVVKDISAVQGMVIVIMMMLSFHAWIYSQTVELFNDRITHSSWFFRKRTVFLKDIDKWSIQVGVFKYTDRFKPTVRLEIHAKKILNVKPIFIPLKLFNKPDLEPLFDALPLKPVRFAT